MKKMFGELNITWKKLIIGAIIIGILVGLINSIPFLLDTSITDPAIYFSFWIFVGILIIVNSKSNIDSALKCFIFFLISQPIIYLVEVPFSHLGWELFGFYKIWFVWTVCCLPMGYIGYYMKKDKWWSLLILIPMLIFVGYESRIYLKFTMFDFPKHFISYLFAISSLISYPLFIFKNKKIKLIGIAVGIIISLVFFALAITNKIVYKTEILCTSESIYFDETYEAFLENKKYGDVSIKTYDETSCIEARFIKGGKTNLIIKSDKNEKKYSLIIKKDSYELEGK